MEMVLCRDTSAATFPEADGELNGISLLFMKAPMNGLEIISPPMTWRICGSTKGLRTMLKRSTQHACSVLRLATIIVLVREEIPRMMFQSLDLMALTKKEVVICIIKEETFCT